MILRYRSPRYALWICCLRRLPSPGVLALLLIVAVAVRAGEASPLEPLWTAQLDAHSAAARSQLRISSLDDEAAALIGEFGQTLRQLEQQRIYNAYLQRLILDQERERQSLQRQLEDFAEVQQGIVPLMVSMVDDLAVFVGLDVPFLLDERRDRIARLRDVLDRADVTDSEKFRQLVEAYQLEAAFGRDIEAYRGPLPGSGREVDFLRVGRILLAWQTPDRLETGFWNPVTRSWEALPQRYRTAVMQGLRIARSQTAPELLVLPITTPELP